MSFSNVAVSSHSKLFNPENHQPARCDTAMDPCKLLIQMVAFAALAVFVVGLALTIAGALVVGSVSVGLLTAGGVLLGAGAAPLIICGIASL